MARTAAQKLPALTSLRFFAASAVVLIHCNAMFGLPADIAYRKRLPLILGVSFFFVLSGFILTYAYPRLENREARWRFLWARFARIWPCHAFAFGCAVLAHWSIGTPLANLWEKGKLGPTLAALGMVHSWVPLHSYYMAWNAPSWSIATEFAFYLMFPILIWRLDKTWHVKLLALLGLAIATLVFCQSRNLPMDPPSGLGALDLLYMNPLARFFEFCLGMVTAMGWKRFSPRIRAGRGSGTLIELAVFALLAANGYFWTDLGDWFMAKAGLYWEYRIWFSHMTTCLCMALLISIVALGRGLISRALSWRGLVLLGEISFAVYLLHFPMLIYVAGHGQTFAAYPGWATLIGYVATLLVASLATWLLIERPMRTFLVGLWPKPSAIPAHHLVTERSTRAKPIPFVGEARRD